MSGRRRAAQRLGERLARDTFATRPHPAVERALGVMRAHLTAPLSLPALADAVSLSPFHFARLFRGATDVSPGMFLAALRLEEAKRLLLTTDLSVAEICFTVGYQSVGTFTARFTRLVGLPPTRLQWLSRQLAASDLRDRDQPGGRIGPAPATAYFVGQARGALPIGIPIAIGLFPAAIPQGRPVADILIAAPGPFTLPIPADGEYRLLAATLPLSADPLALLLPGARQWLGKAARPLLVRGGRAYGPKTIDLRPANPLDPPVLLALPALLFEPFAPHHRPLP